jgi:hypothetical protein
LAPRIRKSPRWEKKSASVDDLLRNVARNVLQHIRLPSLTPLMRLLYFFFYVVNKIAYLKLVCVNNRGPYCRDVGSRNRLTYIGQRLDQQLPKRCAGITNLSR